MDWRWVFQGVSSLAQLYCHFQTFKLNALSESWVTETYSTCLQLLLERPCEPQTGKKTQEHSWEPGLSPFREGLSWRPVAWTSFFGPMCILWRELTRLRPKEVKPWYVCLCWDPWVKADRREQWKSELHQIQRTDKLLASIVAVLRQLMASEIKDSVSMYFLVSFLKVLWHVKTLYYITPSALPCCFQGFVLLSFVYNCAY